MAIVHLALAVRDVRRSSRFFEATLGWRPIDRPANIAVASAWLEIAPGQEVHLLEVADFAPSPFEREYGRHIAVAVPGEGFASLKRRLEQNGAEVFAPGRATPFERFFFRDGDGYVFEVVAAEREPEI
jgi:catechol 2,3-dioxygenase-like lactoylglutathione lyase family enzyme